MTGLQVRDKLLTIPRSLLLFLILPLSLPTYAADGGRISGTVADRTGALIPKAAVTATNTDTGVRQVVTTNGSGAYSFPSLPVGRYDVAITAAGFRPYRRASIMLDVNSALLVDARARIGRAL